ncbi:MAG: hypothetical protein ACI4IR_03025 [Eubacterium sp.]
MKCNNCTREINDYSVVCPYCGVATGVAPKINAEAEKMKIEIMEKDLVTAKTLAIIAIVGGIFSPLIGWICGGIGFSKVNNLIQEYGSKSELLSAKGLNIAGIAVGSINFVVAMFILMSGGLG